MSVNDHASNGHRESVAKQEGDETVNCHVSHSADVAAYVAVHTQPDTSKGRQLSLRIDNAKQCSIVMLDDERCFVREIAVHVTV